VCDRHERSSSSRCLYSSLLFISSSFLLAFLPPNSFFFNFSFFSPIFSFFLSLSPFISPSLIFYPPSYFLYFLFSLSSSIFCPSFLPPFLLIFVPPGSQRRNEQSAGRIEEILIRKRIVRLCTLRSVDLIFLLSNLLSCAFFTYLHSLLSLFILSQFLLCLSS
jgi:hypothetical protein